MRMKKELNELEAKAQEIVFPSADHSFDRFKGTLREIIDENCGYSISKTLQYCDYDQVFYVTVEASGKLLCQRECEETDEADRACVTLTRGVTIDPKLPLMPQIERINNVKDEVQRRHNLLGQFLAMFKEGYKMTKEKV